MRAHIFDMDGTLLRGTTASLLLAQLLGTENALRALEERFGADKHTTVEFAQNLHATRGVVPAEAAVEAFANAPLLDNVEAVLRDIQARGERACLITLSPNCFAELFLPLGFDAVYSSSFPRDARIPFDPGKILYFEDKPRLARVFCEAHGLRLEEAVAYGDSISDVFLFETVGYRISVNGDHHLRDLCDIEIRGNDLYEAYRAARRYIDRPDGHDRQRGIFQQALKVFETTRADPCSYSTEVMTSASLNPQRQTIVGEIPALVWRGAGEGPHPVVVYMHGGNHTKWDVDPVALEVILPRGVTLLSFDLWMHGDRIPTTGKPTARTADRLLTSMERCAEDLFTVCTYLSGDPEIDENRVECTATPTVQMSRWSHLVWGCLSTRAFPYREQAISPDSSRTWRTRGRFPRLRLPTI